MEHHPQPQQSEVATTTATATSTVKGNANATNVPCPESVLKGTHRAAYAALTRCFDFKDDYLRRVESSVPITPETFRLSSDQIRDFHRTGCLVLRAADFWAPAELDHMLAAVNSMDAWPEQAGKWMKYFEKTRDANGNKLLCRVENFTQYEPTLHHVLHTGKLSSVVGQLFGEQAVLYKEKINYKLPGGDGFAPHQDVAAGWWMYDQSLHISVLVAIDAANAENGALEVVHGQHDKGLLCEPWKEITNETCNTMEWHMLSTQPGDIVFFDSFVPHRSGPNHSKKPRRALYATFAKLSEGDLRAQYYADKRLSFPPDIERDVGKSYEYKI